MKSTAADAPARVLVVDDDLMMREILGIYLEPGGYEVVSASDGQEAWDILQHSATPFDVLVTDREMPAMNGMQLLAKVKADPRFDRLPVIFQTGLTSRDEIVEGINAGVYYYLTKPYEQKVLLALIDAAIGDERRYRSIGEQAKRYVKTLELLHQGEFRFRSLHDVYEMSALLSHLSCQPEKVASGLSELLLNAVEHGNLGITYAEKSEFVLEGVWQHEVERRLQLPEYRERYVTVELLREPASTTFKITDQGKGFNPEEYMEFDPLRATDVHGRGIAMSRLMSFGSVEYLGCGNQVVARVEH